MAEARSTTHTAILLTALGFVMVAPHGTLSLRSTSSDRGGSWLDLDEPVEAANELEEVSLANRIHVEVLLHPMAFCAWKVIASGKYSRKGNTELKPHAEHEIVDEV